MRTLLLMIGTHALNTTKFATILLMPDSQVNSVTRVGTTWCTGTLGGNIAKMIKVQVLGVVANMVTSKVVLMTIVLKEKRLTSIHIGPTAIKLYFESRPLTLTSTRNTSLLKGLRNNMFSFFLELE